MRVTMLLLAVLFAAVAQGQSPFPSRPIKVLVTIPPGGAPDISARLLGRYTCRKRQGWSVVIENRPGANGNIACRRGREVGARRLHADSRRRQRDHHQSARLLQARLRPAQGPRAGDCDRDQPVHAVDQSRAAGEHIPGIHRLRPQRPSRRCPMPPAATAASTSSAWRCSSSAPASTSCTCRFGAPHRRPGDRRRRYQGAVLGLGERSLIQSGQLRPLASQRQEPLPALPRPADDRRVLSRICRRHLARPVRPGRRRRNRW